MQGGEHIVSYGDEGGGCVHNTEIGDGIDLDGNVIAGDAGLNLVGGTYGSIAHAAAAFDSDQFLRVLRLAKHSLIGHLLAISVLFTVPLATIVAISHKSKQNGDESSARHNLRHLQIFGIAFLAPLLLVVAWSTALFVGNGTGR